MNNTRYIKGLNSLQKNSNEKKILAQEITKFISENKVNSVLDVGAGPGDLAFKIYKSVKEYTAIEKKPDIEKYNKFKKELESTGVTNKLIQELEIYIGGWWIEHIGTEYKKYCLYLRDLNLK